MMGSCPWPHGSNHGRKTRACPSWKKRNEWMKRTVSAGTICSHLSILARQAPLDRAREPKGIYRGFQGLPAAYYLRRMGGLDRVSVIGVEPSQSSQSTTCGFEKLRPPVIISCGEDVPHKIWGPFRAGPRRDQSVSPRSGIWRNRVSVIWVFSWVEPSEYQSSRFTTSGFDQPPNVIIKSSRFDQPLDAIIKFVGVLFEEAA
jgi:hypothetical protein